MASAKNTRFGSGLITRGAIYAAGTTNYKAQVGSAATNLPTGQIGAEGGFAFEDGRAKTFAAGTYYGTGQASAAIIDSGLTTITHVFHGVDVPGNAGTTVLIARGVWHWCSAEATVGSFYLRAVRRGSAGTIDEWLPGTGAASTVKWFAFGAR